MTLTPRPLVIKTTSGLDRPEACNQAFTVAATAVAAGADVSLWLTGEAAWFGLPGRAAELELAHATPLADLLDVVLEGGQARHHRRRRDPRGPHRGCGGLRRGVARGRRAGARLLRRPGGRHAAARE